MRTRIVRLLVVLWIGFTLPGCGHALPEQAPIALPPKTPLSVDDWRKLPPAEKYDPGTFERLKLHDPKLASDTAWKKFMAEVVVPEQKKDTSR